MREETLQVFKREKSGKEASKKLRKKGYIPAIIYGKGMENLPIQVIYSDFEKIYNRHKEETVLFNLILENGSEKKIQAILKDVQRHPVTDRFIHLDFQYLEVNRPIEIKVPLKFVGKPVGITKGGVLEIILHEITLECLPKDIPDKIVIDLSALDVNQSLHIRDIKVPEGVRIVDDPQETVVTVVAEEETSKGSSGETP